MSDHYKKAEKALVLFKRGLRERKWSRKMINAAQGGWEWALEQMYDHKKENYAEAKMDGDGSDAAYDLADGLVVCGDITRREKETYADYVYEGIRYARRYVRETYGDGED